MEGWIKLHRKILDWEWYKDYPVRILFEHLLLTANYEEKKWKGQQINKGQLITSIAHLSEQTGLSSQQVRTALEKLKSTSEITYRATNKNTLVTIENYGLYQSQEEIATSKSTNKITNEQQTNNNNIRNKEYINNNIYISNKEDAPENNYREYFESIRLKSKKLFNREE